MASKLLEVRNLHVSFGDEPAVRGVSFDIEAGRRSRWSASRVRASP